MARDHDCKDELRAAGSRATAGRLAMLGVLERAQGPLSVREILERLGGKLDQVTLYRALESLADKGLLRRGMREDGAAQYEYAGRPHHHHLVCSDCGVQVLCKVC